MNPVYQANFLQLNWTMIEQLFLPHYSYSNLPIWIQHISDELIREFKAIITEWKYWTGSCQGRFIYMELCTLCFKSKHIAIIFSYFDASREITIFNIFKNLQNWVLLQLVNGHSISVDCHIALLVSPRYHPHFYGNILEGILPEKTIVWYWLKMRVKLNPFIDWCIFKDSSW